MFVDFAKELLKFAIACNTSSYGMFVIENSCSLHLILNKLNTTLINRRKFTGFVMFLLEQGGKHIIRLLWCTFNLSLFLVNLVSKLNLLFVRGKSTLLLFTVDSLVLRLLILELNELTLKFFSVFAFFSISQVFRACMLFNLFFTNYALLLKHFLQYLFLLLLFSFLFFFLRSNKLEIFQVILLF